MKRLLICLLVFWTGLLSADDSSEKYSFLLISPSSMDSGVVERVQVWMETNLHYRVRSLRLESWEGEDSVAQVTGLAEHFTPGDLAVVILTDRLENPRNHAVIVPEVPVGLINVPVLKTEDREKFCRRLERQAMRIVGFKLGLEPTPMPFCALAPYTSLKQLDQMGRGFSPPAMSAYRAALEERGIPLSERAQKALPSVQYPRMPMPPSIPELPKP